MLAEQQGGQCGGNGVRERQVGEGTEADWVEWGVRG